MTLMFGVIVPGDALNVNPKIVSDSELSFQLRPESNHVVVFLTGHLPFPPGMGGSVYIVGESQQSIGGQASSGVKDYIFMGFISNDKPSAIFKLAQNLTPNLTPAASAANTPRGVPQQNALETSIVLANVRPPDNYKELRVLVEPLADIGQKVTPKEVEANRKADYVSFTRAMCQSCYDHLSSWILTRETMLQKGT